MDIDKLQSANAPSCALISTTRSKTQQQSSPCHTGSVHWATQWSPLKYSPGFREKHPSQKVQAKRTLRHDELKRLKNKNKKGYASKLIHLYGCAAFLKITREKFKSSTRLPILFELFAKVFEKVHLDSFWHKSLLIKPSKEFQFLW